MFLCYLVFKKAIAMLGKLLPLERLYLKSFSIPKAKLLNSLYTTRVPEDEEVLALVDLSDYGSARNCILFTTKGVHFHYKKKQKESNPIFFPYVELFHPRITLKIEKEVVQINNELISIPVSSNSVNAFGLISIFDCLEKNFKELEVIYSSNLTSLDLLENSNNKQEMDIIK